MPPTPMPKVGVTCQPSVGLMSKARRDALVERKRPANWSGFFHEVVRPNGVSMPRPNFQVLVIGCTQ